MKALKVAYELLMLTASDMGEVGSVGSVSIWKISALSEVQSKYGHVWLVELKIIF